MGLATRSSGASRLLLGDIRPGAIEIARIPWTDVGETHITVQKRISKGQKATRHIPLFPRAQASLAALRVTHGNETGPFFWAYEWWKVQEFWDLLRTHLKWMEKTHVPYSFRHTCCTYWGKMAPKISAQDAADWAGHSLMIQQKHYMHQLVTNDNFANLVKAVGGELAAIAARH